MKLPIRPKLFAILLGVCVFLASLAPAAQAADGAGEKIPVLLRYGSDVPMPRKSELLKKYDLEEEDLQYLPGAAGVFTAKLTPGALRAVSEGEPARVDFNLANAGSPEKAVPVTAELFGFVTFTGESALYTAVDSRIVRSDGGFAVKNEMLSTLGIFTVRTWLQKFVNGRYVTVGAWADRQSRPDAATARDYEAGNATADANGKYYYNTLLTWEYALDAGEGEDFRTVTEFEFEQWGSVTGGTVRIFAYPDGSRTTTDESIPDSVEENAEGKRWVRFLYFAPEIGYIDDNGNPLEVYRLGHDVYTPKKSALEQSCGLAENTLNVDAAGYYYGLLSEEEIDRIAKREPVYVMPGARYDSTETYISGDIFGFTYLYETGEWPLEGKRYVSVGGDLRAENGKITVSAELLTLEKTGTVVTLLQKKENGKFVTVATRKTAGEAENKAWTAADLASGAATFDPGDGKFLQNLTVADEFVFDAGEGEYRAKVIFRYGSRIVCIDLYPDGRRFRSGCAYSEGAAASNISSRDALYALRCAARLETPVPFEALERIAADFDGDGRISSADARAILRLAAKIVE